jgi:WD40 repeat protein
VHDLQSGASPRVFDSHVRRVKKLQCEDGNPHLLFSASADSTVRMFDLRWAATPPPPRAGSLRQAAAEALQAPNVLVAVQHGRVELHRRAPCVLHVCRSSKHRLTAA